MKRHISRVRLSGTRVRSIRGPTGRMTVACSIMELLLPLFLASLPASLLVLAAVTVLVLG